MKKIRYIFLAAVFVLAVFSAYSFAQHPASGISEYLCDIAEEFYRNKMYDNALHEFKKAVMADPGNIRAGGYIERINNIFSKSADGHSAVSDKKAIDNKPKADNSLSRIDKNKAGALDKKKDSAVSGRAQEREPAPGSETGLKLMPRRDGIEKKPLPFKRIFRDDVRDLRREREAAAEGPAVIKPEAKDMKGIPKKEIPPIKARDKIKGAKKEIKILKKSLPARLSKKEAVDLALQKFEKETIITDRRQGGSDMPKDTRGPLTYQKKEEKQEEGYAEIAAVKISGEIQARAGITSDDFYWKRANWDLNEKNFRTISNTAFDRRINTFDTRIYDRLSFNLDANSRDLEGLGLHTNIVIDPWSFTAKSDKITVYSDFGDSANVELKYWSNTGYAINEIVNTKQLGNSFALPEIKVEDDKAKAFDIKGAFTPNDTFHIPGLKLHREFQPVRELWFDYVKEDMKLRIFPFAYENQAAAFDDPLKLSNNHTWWEDSPWLRGWKHGQLNSGAVPQDFTKGYWDNSLSFFARDSQGRRLSLLRGFSFEFTTDNDTSFITSAASPKNPWQDYSEYDNFLSASRLKQAVGEQMDLGLTATTRFGYDADNKDKLDARNYVAGADASYEIVDGIKASLEVSRSQSEYDLTNSQYQADSRGNAYYFSIIGRFPARSIRQISDYNMIQPDEKEGGFTKFRFFGSRLDPGFDASLSSYTETRDDEFWSRHLHFREPFKYYYQGEGQKLSWDDVESYRIGTGIDIGASTLGLRVETLGLDRRIENLFDARNVHYTDGDFLENTARDEFTWKANDRLTAKIFALYHRLPRTHAGIDPYISNPLTGKFFTNTEIESGKNPSVATGSLGLEYSFFDWVSMHGIWEYTNDISLGYDNFPRGILNTGSRSLTFYENGNKYRDVLNSLYSQQFFPKPPYPYYNIFKTGLTITPVKQWEFFLDYTRNPYEKAGPVDDNMNHIGLTIGYKPSAKLAVFLKYTYSRWQDLDSLIQGITKVFGHHNMFAELIYRKSVDEDFTFQFGEASRDPYMGGVLDIGWDPYGGALRTIDTQHIVRLFYRRKF